MTKSSCVDKNTPKALGVLSGPGCCFERAARPTGAPVLTGRVQASGSGARSHGPVVVRLRRRETLIL